MLKISPAISVNNVPVGSSKNNYTLFPDDEDQNLYYAMAERPDFFLNSEGKPSFNMTWYFGGGATPGGICTMTLALPMPDMNVQGVRDQLAAAVNNNPTMRKIAQLTFQLCQAMVAGETERVTQLKGELGYTDEVAASKKAGFDPNRDWAQFLPNRDAIDIRPIPFTKGSVTVKAFAGEQNYIENKPEVSSGELKTTPSLVNSNAAVVTFNLKEIGANLFWHGLGGPKLDKGSQPDGYDAQKGGDSIISVVYNVSFEGLLPHAKAVVTLDKAIYAKLEVGYNIRRGTWGTHYQAVKRGETYNNFSDGTIDITLPSVASKDDKKSVEEILTTWAASQLENMVQTQIPDVKLEDLTIEGLHKLERGSKQTRTYKLTKAIEVAKTPQGQLAKLEKLVPQAELTNYFHLIDLNKTPYFHADVTVNPPSFGRMANQKVERFVVTQLSYANERLRDESGKEVTILEYVTPTPQKAQGSQPLAPKLKGTFSKQSPNKDMEYEYLITYSDGTRSLQASGAVRNNGDDSRNRNYLNLSDVDLGVLSVKLDSTDLPWDIIGSAYVTLSYGDWEKRVTLVRNEVISIVQPFGKAMEGMVGHQLTLNLNTGAPFVDIPRQRRLKDGNAEIILVNPLGDATYEVHVALDPGVTKAQLRMEYVFKSTGPDRTFVHTVTLDAATMKPNEPVWKVPGFRDIPSSFRVTRARVTTSAGATDLKDLSGGTIGDVNAGFEITVSKDSLSNF
ncbi:hypothetical protein [Roseomonas genomospecies 6]|uniref:Uncharacterized protein n=1 Tax=Roseomonas genomospecies 6 TaxID=214106 RepID=A0A9W7KQ04_9PROT|nr:hypothetical protein [Roseomonas genomospecies 6]KAA0677166.1 hypothetical protein DS843_24555 [Roseomonas genomospecies 6]